jgi:hypothetical protein
VMHRTLCVGPIKDQRLGCCKPTSPMKAIYNTMIENGRIVAYVGPDNGLGNSVKDTDWSVPSVHSVPKQQDFTMKIETRKSYFCRECCKRYVNGTLHVIGKHTINNMFHTSEF